MNLPQSKQSLRWLAALACALMLAGCGSKSPKEDAEEERFHMKRDADQKGYVEFVGKVTYVPFEGGFYGLVDGTNMYDPLLLPKEFQQDGLKVKVRARLRDWVSGRNWGRMVHVVAIEPCCDKDKDKDKEEDD